MLLFKRKILNICMDCFLSSWTISVSFLFVFVLHYFIVHCVYDYLNMLCYSFLKALFAISIV